MSEEVGRLRARVTTLEHALRSLADRCPSPSWALRAALRDDTDPPSMIEAASREYREALAEAARALSTEHRQATPSCTSIADEIELQIPRAGAPTSEDFNDGMRAAARIARAIETASAVDGGR